MHCCDCDSSSGGDDAAEESGTITRRRTRGRSIMSYIVIVSLLGGSILLLGWWGVTSASENAVAQAWGGSNNGYEQVLRRMKSLETKLAWAEKTIQDLVFHTPQVLAPSQEVLTLKLTLPSIASALRKGVDDISVSFNAGVSKIQKRFKSNWTLYLTLSSKNSSVNLHLALDDWDRKVRQLFVGLQGRCQDGDKIQRRKEIVNILDDEFLVQTETEQWHEISIPDILTWDGPFATTRDQPIDIDATVQLLGYGHRLYKKNETNSLSRDPQTVVFGVENWDERLAGETERSTRLLASSRFELRHPWSLKSCWTVQVVKAPQSHYLSLLLNLTSLQDIPLGPGYVSSKNDLDTTSQWPQFYAKVDLEVSHQHNDDIKSKHISSSQIHDFAQRNVLTMPKIMPTQDLASNDFLEFTITVTSYNKNARYYVDA